MRNENDQNILDTCMKLSNNKCYLSSMKQTFLESKFYKDPLSSSFKASSNDIPSYTLTNKTNVISFLVLMTWDHYSQCQPLYNILP